jgi:hypothetical protein
MNNTLFNHDADIDRLETFDDRFYQINLPTGESVYYPSVTTILGDIKVGSTLDNWKQEQAAALGVEGAKFDMWMRANRGKAVHDAVERYSKGESVEWCRDDGSKRYDDDEWRAITRYVQWCDAMQPTVLATEHTVFSHEHGYAGTCDLIVEIGGLRYVVDVKTSKQVMPSHELQVTAYLYAVREMFPAVDVHGAAVLALNTKHKVGYHWKTVDDVATTYRRFCNLLTVFRDEHPTFDPKIDVLPATHIPTHAIGALA